VRFTVGADGVRFADVTVRLVVFGVECFALADGADFDPVRAN
jgi:hypothetical protein